MCRLVAPIPEVFLHCFIRVAQSYPLMWVNLRLAISEKAITERDCVRRVIKVLLAVDDAVYSDAAVEELLKSQVISLHMSPLSRFVAIMLSNLTQILRESSRLHFCELWTINFRNR